MRHVVLAAGVALALALGLVLVMAGGDEDVVVEDPTETAGSTEPLTVTETVPVPPEDARPPDDPAQIERAVALYIEAAERGEVDAQGLPTSDELSIEAVRARGRRGTVHLVGGAELDVRKEGGRWRVVRARPGRIPAPTPPSNGP